MLGRKLRSKSSVDDATDALAMGGSNDSTTYDSEDGHSSHEDDEGGLEPEAANRASPATARGAAFLTRLPWSHRRKPRRPTPYVCVWALLPQAGIFLQVL